MLTYLKFLVSLRFSFCYDLYFRFYFVAYVDVYRCMYTEALVG